MTTVTSPSTYRPFSSNGSAGPAQAAPTPTQIRIAGAGDRDRLQELADRADKPLPSGRLMVAEAGDRLVAAVTLNGDRAVAEPGSAGSDAVAVLRYTVQQMHGRRHVRRQGTPS